MLKKVLKCIADGNSSLPDIANALGMDESAVLSAVEELKRMGYLESKPGCAMDKPACRSCPVAASMIAILCVTEKGAAYLKKN